jgi:hypothetical protein
VIKFGTFRSYRGSTRLGLRRPGTPVLEHMDTSDTSTLPPTARVYLQFISTLSDHGFVQHELPYALLDVTRTYRNPAAHPEVLDFARLHDFARLLFGEAEARGLLVRVIEATEPVRLR